MFEPMKEMTREELIAEKDKYRVESEELYKDKCSLECYIKKQQNNINCLEAQLKDLQEKKQKLPIEPIDVAAMLIKETKTYKASPLQKMFNPNAPEEYGTDRYSAKDLKEIAEHLLAYCNNQENGE